MEDLGRRGYALAEEAATDRLGGRGRAGLAVGTWVGGGGGVLEVEGEVEARGGRGDSHVRERAEYAAASPQQQRLDFLILCFFF